MASVHEFGGTGSLDAAVAHYDAMDGAAMVAACQLNAGGSRRYVCGPTPAVLAMVASCVVAGNAPWYEVLCGTLRLYADLERVREEGVIMQTYDDDALCVARAFVNHARSMGAFSATATVLSAHRGAKISYHVVAVMRDGEGRELVTRGIDDARLHALHAIAHADRARAMDMVDTSVYKNRKQNFRFARCVKFGSPDSVLVPAFVVDGELTGTEWGVHTRTSGVAPVRADAVLDLLNATRVNGDDDAALCAMAGAELDDMGGVVGDVLAGHPALSGVDMQCFEPLKAALCTALGVPDVSWGGYWQLTGHLVFTVHRVPCALHGRVHKQNGTKYVFDFGGGMEGFKVHQKCHNVTPTLNQCRKVRVPVVERAAAGSVPGVLHVLRETFVLRKADLLSHVAVAAARATTTAGQ